MHEEEELPLEADGEPEPEQDDDDAVEIVSVAWLIVVVLVRPHEHAGVVSRLGGCEASRATVSSSSKGDADRQQGPDGGRQGDQQAAAACEGGQE